MLRIGADKAIILNQLKDVISGSYLDATTTVAGQLLDADENEIDTFTLTYEAASNGKFEGTIPAATTAVLEDAAEYIIVITATTAAGVIQKFLNRLVAYAIDDNWVQPSSYYFNSLGSLSETDKNALSTYIKTAQDSVELYTGRKFKSQEITEVKTVRGQGTTFLHWPITKVSRLQTNTVNCLQIQNTTATNSSVSVTTTGLNLTRYNAGTRTDVALAFATYTTIGALETAIDALGNGWVSTADSTYSSYPSADMLQGQIINTQSARSLQTWVEQSLDLYVDMTLGIIHNTFAEDQLVRLTYTAGYSDVPEPIKRVVADLAMELLNTNDGKLKSENLDGYSYEIFSPSEAVSKIPITNRMILNAYRDTRV